MYLYLSGIPSLYLNLKMFIMNDVRFVYRIEIKKKKKLKKNEENMINVDCDGIAYYTYNPDKLISA